MELLTLEDFAAQVGQPYDTAVGAESVPLTLEAAEPIANAARDGGGFRLQWLGPTDPVLPQAIYRMSAAGAEHDIFIVPIARSESGTRYEAVFN